MNEHQACLLGMLDEIDEICTRHDIHYFLHGGTLLGAARNGGFLPWDDDIDIAMPYDDFLRFTEACKEDLPAGRLLRQPLLDPAYRRVMPRYMSTETTAIRVTSSLHDDPAGETIDIFVLDPVADGDEAWREYRRNLYLYHSFASYANANGTRAEVSAAEFRELVELAQREGRAHVNRMLDDRLTSTFSADGSRYAIRWKGFQGPAERSWFASSKPIAFEGRMLQAPDDVDAYLCLLFGEEWYRVPAKINPAKHDVALSLKVPCAEALEFFEPKHDREALLTGCEDRIELRLSNAKEANALNDERTRARADVVGLSLERHVQDHRDEFDAALARHDGPELARLLNWYLAIQTSKSLIGRPLDSGCYRYYKPVLVPADDDVFDAALIALLSTSRTGHARRLLDIARTQGRTGTETTREVERALGRFRACVRDYECGRFAEGLDEARELVGFLPQSSEFHMLACAHAKALFDAKPDAANRGELERLVDEASRRFPREGCFIKLRADLMRADGKEDEALPLYLQAAENTDNGFTLHSIAQTCGYYPARLRTPKWAIAAHVPQWESDLQPAEIEEPDANRADEPSPTASYLFELLREAVALLEAHGVRYVAAPALAQALFVDGRIPEQLGAYALLCEHGALPSLLKASLPENRELCYMGNDLTFKGCGIRYEGTDSFHLSLEKPAGDHHGLFVSLVPLEPTAYPALLDSGLHPWSGPSGAKRSAVERAVRRMGRKSPAARGRLFKHAARQRAAERLTVRFAGRSFAFEASPLEETVGRSFSGLTLQVPASPADIADYARIDVGKNLYVSDIASTDPLLAGHGYDWFVARGAFDPSLPERRAALSQKNKPGQLAFARFNENFRQIKLAVQVKELSVGLIPRKEEILALADQGDRAALGEILAPYVALVEKNAGAGNVCFDPEILEIAETLLANRPDNA